MNQKMKKKIKHYLHEIATALPAGYPNKKLLLRTLQQNIDDFLEEYPNADWEAVTEHFGSSDDLARSYMEQLSDAELATSYKTHHRTIFVSTIACFTALIFLFLGIYSFYLWKQTHDFIIEETMTVYDGTEIWEQWESEALDEDIN